MGYDTYYSGELTTNRELTDDEKLLFKGMQNHPDWKPDWNTDFELLPCTILPPNYILRINEEDNRAYHWRIELEFLVENFFKPNNIILNGSIDWSGENSDDHGTCVVTNNEITIFEDKPTIELIKALNELLIDEKVEHLANAKDRHWKDFDSPGEYMEDLEPFTDDDHTLFEQGYRSGIQQAIYLITNLSQEGAQQ